MQITQGTQTEIEWQAGRATRIAEVAPTPDYIFERYRAAKYWRHLAKEYVFHLLKNCQGKSVFDFGCGEGEFATQCAKLGGHLTSMDISPELIELASRRAMLDGVRDQIEFVVADILHSPPPPDSFDYVVCNAVLHHVDLYAVLPILMGCLKPGGTAIIVEPIAFSPALQKLRDRTPVEKDVSPGERQLGRADIDFILSHLSNPSIKHFNLFGRFIRMFPNSHKIDKGHVFTKAAILAITGLDRLLLDTLPVARSLSGTVVITGQKRPQGS